MAIKVSAHITGTVWKIEVSEGDSVSSDQVLVILESMKMEMPIESPQEGKVKEIHVKEGQPVNEGDIVITIELTRPPAASPLAVTPSRRTSRGCA